MFVSTSFYAEGLSPTVAKKAIATRYAAPGEAATITERNPSYFKDLRIKPHNEAIDNKHFVPQKYLKPR